MGVSYWERCFDEIFVELQNRKTGLSVSDLSRGGGEGKDILEVGEVEEERGTLL